MKFTEQSLVIVFLMVGLRKISAEVLSGNRVLIKHQENGYGKKEGGMDIVSTYVDNYNLDYLDQEIADEDYKEDYNDDEKEESDYYFELVEEGKDDKNYEDEHDYEEDDDYENDQVYEGDQDYEDELDDVEYLNKNKEDDFILNPMKNNDKEYYGVSNVDVDFDMKDFEDNMDYNSGMEGFEDMEYNYDMDMDDIKKKISKPAYFDDNMSREKILDEYYFGFDEFLSTNQDGVISRARRITDGALYRENFEEGTPSWVASKTDLIVQSYNTGGIDGKIMRARYRPFSRGSPRLFNRILFDDVKSGTLSFDFKLHSQFEFVKGGKMHGLAGGSATTGCKDIDPNGWSVRMMWRREGEVEAYIYHQDRKNRCGDSYRAQNFRLESSF